MDKKGQVIEKLQLSDLLVPFCEVLALSILESPPPHRWSAESVAAALRDVDLNSAAGVRDALQQNVSQMPHALGSFMTFADFFQRLEPRRPSAWAAVTKLDRPPGEIALIVSTGIAEAGFPSILSFVPTTGFVHFYHSAAEMDADASLFVKTPIILRRQPLYNQRTPICAFSVVSSRPPSHIDPLADFMADARFATAPPLDQISPIGPRSANVIAPQPLGITPQPTRPSPQAVSPQNQPSVHQNAATASSPQAASSTKTQPGPQPIPPPSSAQPAALPAKDQSPVPQSSAAATAPAPINVKSPATVTAANNTSGMACDCTRATRGQELATARGFSLLTLTSAETEKISLDDARQLADTAVEMCSDADEALNACEGIKRNLIAGAIERRFASLHEAVAACEVHGSPGMAAIVRAADNSFRCLVIRSTQSGGAKEYVLLNLDKGLLAIGLSLVSVADQSPAGAVNRLLARTASPGMDAQVVTVLETWHAQDKKAEQPSSSELSKVLLKFKDDAARAEGEYAILKQRVAHEEELNKVRRARADAEQERQELERIARQVQALEREVAQLRATITERSEATRTIRRTLGRQQEERRSNERELHRLEVLVMGGDVPPPAPAQAQAPAPVNAMSDAELAAMWQEEEFHRNA